MTLYAKLGTSAVTAFLKKPSVDIFTHAVEVSSSILEGTLEQSTHLLENGTSPRYANDALNVVDRDSHSLQTVTSHRKIRA